MHRYLSLFLLLSTLLFAEKDVSATLKVSTLHPVVKEPVILKLHIRPDRTDKVLNFDFNPHSTSDYVFKLLESTEKQISSSQNDIIYTYALFPLKSGELRFHLFFTYKEATKEEVKKFVTGSADELTYLQTTNTNVPLKTFTLNVSPLKENTQLVGDFTLQMNLDKNNTTAGKQINVIYTLKGRGYKPNIQKLLKIKNVEIFESHEHFEDKLFNKEIYRYAILSDHNFTLPALSIKAYSPKRGQYYTLTSTSVPVTVSPVSTQHSNTPNTATILAFIGQSVNYLYFFIGGLLVALIVKTFYKKNEYTFVDKIKETRAPRELLHLLLVNDHKKYHKFIIRLEDTLYHNKKISLHQLKREIIGEIKTKGSVEA